MGEVNGTREIQSVRFAGEQGRARELDRTGSRRARVALEKARSIGPGESAEATQKGSPWIVASRIGWARPPQSASDVFPHDGRREGITCPCFAFAEGLGSSSRRPLMTRGGSIVSDCRSLSTPCNLPFSAIVNKESLYTYSLHRPIVSLPIRRQSHLVCHEALRRQGNKAAAIRLPYKHCSSFSLVQPLEVWTGGSWKGGDLRAGNRSKPRLQTTGCGAAFGAGQY